MKHRSYFLRCGAVTEMSLTSRSTGSATAASALKAAVCELAGKALPGVCPFGCADDAISTRLRFDAGSSRASTEASRPCTKLAISLNKVVRAGVSGRTERRKHASSARLFSRLSAS